MKERSVHLQPVTSTINEPSGFLKHNLPTAWTLEKVLYIYRIKVHLQQKDIQEETYHSSSSGL